MTDVRIVVPTCGTTEPLIACLGHIRRSRLFEDYEIVVDDDSSGSSLTGRNLPPGVNTVHFMMRMATVKSIRVVGCGVRGRSL